MKKNYLPRHTILAPHSSRIGAAIVDASITLAFVLALFYGCFNLVFSNAINPLLEQELNYQLASHLCYFDESKSQVAVYSTNDDYSVYETPVTYYYLSYLTGEFSSLPEGKSVDDLAAPNYKEEITLDNGEKVLAKDYYTIEWYNKNILEIDDTNAEEGKTTTLFKYARDEEGNIDKSVLGVPKSERFNSDKNVVEKIDNTMLATFYASKYTSAYNHLINQSFYLEVSIPRTFLQSTSLTLAIVLGGLINYLIIPLFLKGGATLGKKLFKLGLANYQGYAIKKYQIILRFIPYLLTSASLLIVTSGMFVVFSLVAVVVLVSFATMMASPKRSALHDYIARTLVIDMKGSIIFVNSLEEEKYIINEDNLPGQVVMGGEEPEISYEK